MPNPRQEPQDTKQQLRDASKTMTEKSDRLGQTVADLGDQAARAGADIAKRGIKTWQTALQSGTELASQLAHQSTEQLARARGASGNESQPSRAEYTAPANATAATITNPNM